MTPKLLQAAPADTVSHDLGAEIAAVADKIANTPTSELFAELLDKAVSFGIKVLVAVALYFIGGWLIRRIKKMLQKIFEKHDFLDQAIESFIMSIAGIALWIILIIAIIGTLGIETTSFAALLAGGGMAIGLALNGTVQNFAGGIMILIFRPFKAGDFIEMQGFTGTVTEVTITSTKLTTTDNRVIIIPNGAISNGTINNYSHMPMRRLDITVDVEYGTSSEKTCDLLQTLIKQDDRILTAETSGKADPFVALSSLKDSSIQFVVRVWVKSEDYWDVNYDLLKKIYEELPKNGVQFPYPKLDINILNRN
ncbi:MAG: mechanosensitive ion channel [Bacteroidales bacterium]|nr:mechanosensitive ion channel [Bacteroidales bacterium]